MIHKHTIWEVTVKQQSGCTCGAFHAFYQEQFLGKPTTAKIAEAIRHDAEIKRAEAKALAGTPDGAGWLEYAEILEVLVGEVEQGRAEIKFRSYKVIEAGEINKRAIDILGRHVTCTTIDDVDFNPDVRLWLQFAAMVYPITLEQIEDWLHSDGAGVRPDCKWLEKHLCQVS